MYILAMKIILCAASKRGKMDGEHRSRHAAATRGTLTAFSRNSASPFSRDIDNGPCSERTWERLITC